MDPPERVAGLVEGQGARVMDWGCRRRVPRTQSISHLSRSLFLLPSSACSEGGEVKRLQAEVAETGSGPTETESGRLASFISQIYLYHHQNTNTQPDRAPPSTRRHDGRLRLCIPTCILPSPAQWNPASGCGSEGRRISECCSRRPPRMPDWMVDWGAWVLR